MVHFLRNGYSLLLMLAMNFNFSDLQAQSTLGEIFNGGVQDAEKLLNAYMAPFGASLGANLNAGWINTAAPLKPGRFELKMVANVAFVPTNEQTYNLDALGFRNPVERNYNGATAVEQWQYSRAVAPTVFGSGAETATITKVLTYQDEVSGQTITQEMAELPLPAGLGFSFNPIAPAPQLSVGLPLGTELMGRYLPGVNRSIDNTDIDFKGIWGIGIKHNIKQWIPGIKRLPFSMSLAVGYSASDASFSFLPVLPQAPGNGHFADPSLAGTAYSGPTPDPATYDGQGVAFRARAWNANLLVSKKVSVLSVYGGFRYAHARSSLRMKGVYGITGDPYQNPDNANDPNNGRYTLIHTEEDPIEVNMPLSQLGLVGGFRLKLAFLSLFAEGNYSKYSTVSAGIGFGWMN
jgi:hypothetical protein